MNRIIASLSFILVATILYSEKSYRILSRGLVLDNSTKLIWTRCPLSNNNKPIYDFNCKGEKKLYSWSEAVEACENLVHDGRSDWRLPNIRELQSIIEYKHYPESDSCSQIHDEVFPNVVEAAICTDFWSTSQFWSSTVYKGIDTCGNIASWYADYKYGNTGWSPHTVYKGPPNLGGNPIRYDTPEECIIISSANKYVRCVAGP